MKSLITKLNGVASNNELIKLNECSVRFCVSNSATPLEEVSNISFTVDNAPYVNKQKVSVGEHLLKISPKSSLTYIRFSDDNIVVDLSSLKGTGNMLSLKEILQTNTSTYHKGNCYKGDLSDLSDFSNLEKIEFEGCKGITGNTSDISKFTNLKVFNGYGTSVDFSDISSLLQLTTLEQLQLGGTGVNIEPFAVLTRLKVLSCRYAPFSGSIENLAQGMITQGRTQGTLRVTCSHSNITYQGNKSDKEVSYTITFSDSSYSVEVS